MKQADFGMVVKQVHEMQAAVLTAMQCKLLSWHCCLGPLPFKPLLILAQEGRIPKHLANCQVPKCPECLFGKMMRNPWRTKGKDKRSIYNDSENYLGGNTSVDQMELTTPGLIPQTTGKLLQATCNSATIFVDHHTGFTYLHLMTSLNSEQMMAAKEMYEQIAQTYGVSIHGYQADNGRFADKEWRQDCNEQHQSLTFFGVGANCQNGITESTSVTSVKAQE